MEKKEDQIIELKQSTVNEVLHFLQLQPYHQVHEIINKILRESYKLDEDKE